MANITVTFTSDNGSGGIQPLPVTAITNSAGLASVTVSGLPVEVYKVTAVAGSGCSSSIAYVSVYDPNGGFVTGGGWITSPVGAYRPDLALTGKANFGFNSKYKKGSNVPEGNTEFQFQTGNLNFSSSSYSLGSLVIAGKQAIYKGIGTINGVVGYSFMVSAIDGQVNGGGNIDKFRIKIWNTSTSAIVYDNNFGLDDNSEPTMTTVLGGGSIVIHSVKTARVSQGITSLPAISLALPTEPLATKFTAKVIGNPSRNQFTLLFSSPSADEIKMNVMDNTGRLIEQRQRISPKGSLQIGQQYLPGIYYAEFMQGTNKVMIKLLKIGN